MLQTEVAKGKVHSILRLEVSQLSKPRVSEVSQLSEPRVSDFGTIMTKDIEGYQDEVQ